MPQGIDHAAALERVFGRWPSFHDAEVLALRLDRGDGSTDPQSMGPRLEADIHVFELTGEVDPGGFYRLRNHTLATMAFHGVDNLTLHDFNNQNVLHGIELWDISDGQLEQLKWDVRFEGAFGMTATFLCARVEVLQVHRLDGPPPPPRPPRQLPPEASHRAPGPRS